GAMLGAAVWRYMITPVPQGLILPAGGAIGGMILMDLGSIFIQGNGLWPEVLWLVVVGIAVFVLYRLVLAAAVKDDRRTLGEDGSRIVCPHCHQLTLRGAFCSRCGEPLPQESTRPI
ncbi:MAG TPA: zinc ribbon domain-containing protein, partial [Thermomicrobiales bacterium]|nr:zinc ribbon domain-containing protein [Thermomicrobiales bacterium]